MKIVEVDKKNKNIKVAIPLTEQTGKARVKNRDIWYAYGYPVATRQIEFSNKFYIEWQIGYDVVTKEKKKLALTTLKKYTFTGANEKEKALYELSEYLYYFYEMDIISKDEIQKLLDEITNIDDNKLIEQNADLSVQRSYPVKYILEGMDFQKSIVQYPLLLYKLSSFEVLVEIIIKEKQKAVGLQPMLYVCFPVTKLQTDKEPLIGRCAQKKETAYLILDKTHKKFVLQTFKIFALLSKAHKHDVIEIIKLILK